MLVSVHYSCGGQPGLLNSNSTVTYHTLILSVGLPALLLSAGQPGLLLSASQPGLVLSDEQP